MDNSFLDFPDNFREEIFTKIQKVIAHHGSVTILAPPGMGKTLTLQLLTKRLPNNLYIDLNSQWEKNISTDKPLTIILDHAENFPDQLYFKSVREAARDKITFAFAISGSTIPSGPLESVLLENIIYLEPLTARDAKVFLEKTEELYQEKLSVDQKQKILELSGGVPRLIKRLCKLFMEGLDPKTDLKLQKDVEEIAKFLRNNSNVKWTVPMLDNATTLGETVNNVQFSETLSKQEHFLAKLLIEKAGQLVTREEMIEAVWKNKKYEVNEHALDQMLHRLRSKLSSATPKCTLTTYRGRGCKLIL